MRAESAALPFLAVALAVACRCATAAELDRILVQLCDMPQDGRNGLVVRGFRFKRNGEQ